MTYKPDEGIDFSQGYAHYKEANRLLVDEVEDLSNSKEDKQQIRERAAIHAQLAQAVEASRMRAELAKMYSRLGTIHDLLTARVIVPQQVGMPPHAPEPGEYWEYSPDHNAWRLMRRSEMASGESPSPSSE